MLGRALESGVPFAWVGGEVAVTQRRTMQDFAQQMRWLVDQEEPRSPSGLGRIRVPGQSEGGPAWRLGYEDLPRVAPAQCRRRIAKRSPESHDWALHGRSGPMREPGKGVLRCWPGAA